MAVSPQSSPGKARRYLIPTHLQVPDKIAIPLLGVTIQVTMRQGLMFLFGLSMAFNMWRQLDVLSAYGMLGLFLRVLGPVALVLATCLVAYLKIADRFLEQWAVVLLTYWRHPRVYIWRRMGMKRSPSSQTNRWMLMRRQGKQGVEGMKRASEDGEA